MKINDFFEGGRINGFPLQLMRVMKITMFIMTMFLLQVSALTKAQITMNEKGASMRKVLESISTQSGYDFVYSDQDLKKSTPLNIKLNNVSLEKALQICFEDQPLMYEISDKTVIVKPKPPTVMEKINTFFLQDSIVFRGIVVNDKGTPMSGASVKNKGTNKIIVTSGNGEFSIRSSVKGTLVVSYVGYITNEITLTGLNSRDKLRIVMTPGENQLGEVSIASNGYQDIPKERQTGSFEVITAKQLQHSTSPNLLKRLEGITTSMNFYNNLAVTNSAAYTAAPLYPAQSQLNRFSIRGRNTLNTINLEGGGASTGYSNTSGQVLVVIDGVPSPYPIENVNPDDVESMTILKDAAAASVWGARAANGVIVIKSKRGAYETPVRVSFNSNFNITEKPDLFYRPMMSTSEFIDAEVYKFGMASTNVRTPLLTRGDPLYSPVEEILGQRQRGEISPEQMNAKLDALRGNDVRNDYTKYLLRNAAQQSYYLAIDGGGKNLTYRISGGYDKTLNNTIASDQDKWSLSYFTSYKPVKNLELTANIDYSRRRTNDQATNNRLTGALEGTTGYYLYTRLVDEQGNSVSIPYKYRPGVVDLFSSTFGDKAPDIHYNPLDNISQGYSRGTSKGVNFNLGANYTFNDFLSANVLYNYNTSNLLFETLYGKNSFYTRDLVARFTAPNGSTVYDPSSGQAIDVSYKQQYPNNAVYFGNANPSNNNTIRGQLNFNKNWSDKHDLNAIAGTEFTDSYTLSKPFQYLGYDEKLLTYTSTIDFVNRFPTSLPAVAGLPPIASQLPNFGNISFTDARVRTYAFYANASYTYSGRYTLTASARKDASSLFGIGTNNHGTPYYSLGASWNIAGEPFYKLSWLPSLKLRGTFGYNGNVNALVQSVATTAVIGTQVTNLPYLRASSADVTNDLLRPEKAGMLNLGLDFGFKNNRLSGSFEYYRRHTTDLLAGNAINPVSGFGSLTFNTADLLSWGTDFTLNSRNLEAGLFSWSSTFLFSYNRVIVEKLYAASATTAGGGVTGLYNEGADLSRIYAYRWAGLNPVTGDPQGYANGRPIIINSGSNFGAVDGAPLSDARYFGSAQPVYFGALRNTFTYGALSVSANILYKLGYYIRRPLADQARSSDLFTSIRPIGVEYSQRWQKPGDEIFTNVPSRVYPAQQQRDIFYQLAEINVLKGDHIRLQEINLSYALSNRNWFIKNPRIYANVNNLGIIWRANKLGVDPDIRDLPNPRTYSFGFSANF